MLMVTGNGYKTFYVYKKVQGRPERIKVGRFPDLSVEQARNRAKVLLAAIAQDKNPSEDKRRIRGTMTIGELFNLYMEKHGQYKKSQYNDRSLYNLYLTPWAHKKLLEIRRADVEDLHKKIGMKLQHPYQANRLRALLHTMYEFSLKRGYEGNNPCRGVEKHQEHKRDRFIQKEELPRFFNVLMNDPHPVIRDFVLVSLFTGARSGNIQAMQWVEINWERSEWHITETKSGQPHTVPIVGFLMDILRQRRKQVDGEWVFPGLTSEGHIRDPKVQWGHICKKVGLDDLHIHDLRRTLGSWMAITGASLLVISQCLGHKVASSNMTGVYARLSMEPVRQAMETAVRTILIHGNVIDSDTV